MLFNPHNFAKCVLLSSIYRWMCRVSKRLNDLDEEFGFKAEIWTQVSSVLSLGIYHYIPLNIQFICLKYLPLKKIDWKRVCINMQNSQEWRHAWKCPAECLAHSYSLCWLWAKKNIDNRQILSSPLRNLTLLLNTCDIFDNDFLLSFFF